MIHNRKSLYALQNILALICCTIQSVKGDTCQTSRYDAIELVSTPEAATLQYIEEDFSYGIKYPSCYWLIVAKNMTYDSIINLQIETDNDGKLIIYDGETKMQRILWKSGKPTNVNSTSQNVLVTFSYRYRQATFKVSYKTITRGDTCMTNDADALKLVPKTLPEELQYQRIVDGYHRNPFPTCLWLIGKNDMCDSAVDLQIDSYDDGRLSIYDGPSRYHKLLWTPGMPRNITSSSQFVLVVFSTQRGVSAMKITYKIAKKGAAVDMISDWPISRVSDECPSSGLKVLLATYGPNYIRSPYLGYYEHPQDEPLRCAWLIVTDCYAVIKMVFTELSIGNSSVRIYDGPGEDSDELGTYSGNDVTNTIVSTGHQVLVTFFIKELNHFFGFTLKYENELEFPVILSSTKIVHEDDNTANIGVSVISYSPIRAVYWLRNGNLLYDDPSIISKQDDVDFNTTDSMVPINFTLSLTSVTEETYGTYKVAIQNDAGFTEKLIELNKPSNCKVTFGSCNIAMNILRLTIQVPVTFSSLYSDAKWFKKKLRINNDSLKYQMTVSNDNNLRQSTFQLVIFSPEVDDYTQYKLSITCGERTAEINIPLQIPDEYMPSIANYSTSVEGNAKISVSYDSNPVPNSVQWEKDSTVLTASGKYRILDDTNTSMTTLVINSVNETDFGTYKLSVTNAAGTRISYFDLNKPKVFPVIRTCNQFQTINISCTIDNCDESFLPWVHSINGTEVRRIAGHVTDLTSTLTISQCIGEDIGRYTCVTEQELQNGTKISITRDYALLSVHASPLIDDTVNVVIDRYRIELRVNVTSNPPIRLLRWFKGDVEMEYGVEVTEQSVQITIRGTLVTTPGYKVELKVTKHTIAFGSYKVYVANDVGVSEHCFQVDDPDESIYVMTEETSFVTNGVDISVSVTFFALPEYNFVSWINTETGIALDTSPRHTITTERKSGRRNEYITNMTITESRASDYTQYKVLVNNKVGDAEFFVTLKNPNEGAPVIRDEVVTTLDGDLAVITVNFTAHPAIQYVSWFKDDTPLVPSQKYNSSTQKQNLKMTNAGSVEIMDGYQSQLKVTDINEGDFGTYRVNLKNEGGYTDKDVILSPDCDKNNSP